MAKHATHHAEIDAVLAPIEALLRPTYESASEEAWQVNGHVEPIDPDDLRSALKQASAVISPVSEGASRG